jgi:membrane fusion protein, multidrug efflux system
MIPLGLRRHPLAPATAALALLTAAALFGVDAVRGEPPKDAAATRPSLATYRVEGQSAASALGFDGVVEAVRHTVVAAQVAGAVVQLDVKVGDRVKAGQLLMRLDARAADQSAIASTAQAQAAQAQLDVATREVQRQRLLFEQQFISRAALDRAEAEFKASQAQLEAQVAQAGVARTQTAFHVVRAPYDGIVSEVPVALGDMALPGRPLVAVVDPTALRVSAALPQSVAARLSPTLPAASVRLELSGVPAGSAVVVPTRVQQLPLLDAGTHTATLRADLPAGLPGVAPGLFARVWVTPEPEPARPGTAAATLRVPAATVVRRAEMTALYVVDAQGRPLLRQVRLGRASGDQVEVLAGLSPGERVALDPQAAARIR